MIFTQNFDLLSVGVVVAATGILGFAVLSQERASETHRAFLGLSLMTMLWSAMNFATYRFNNPALVLWLVRSAIFFAVLYAYYVFHLAYVFPKKNVVFPNWYKYLLLPIVVIVAYINLSPLVFVKVASFGENGVIAETISGPLIGLFGALVIFLNFGGLAILAKKYIKARKAEKRQIGLVLGGLLLTLSLIVFFNFILPAFYSNADFVKYGSIFTFPFIILSAFSIIKYKLLNVKLISTELLVFVIAVASLFEVIFSTDTASAIYRSIFFILILGAGILLIRSVRKEIKQREKMAALAESLEKANIRLQELDRQKTEFLSIASHQLRTPLSIIKGYVELIKDGAYGKASGKMKTVLSDMDESNERLVKLVDEFLDISRIEQGRTKYQFESVDVCKLVNSVISEIAPRAEIKNLSIVFESSLKICNIVADEEKIRHVVFNFVDNATKYTQEGGITIKLEHEKKGISLRVQDTGLGFDKTDEVNFFQKFYRGRNVEHINVNGTGLGLFVCRKFIENHGGKVWAKSKGLGKGGEFGFWLPLRVKRSKSGNY